MTRPSDNSTTVSYIIENVNDNKYSNEEAIKRAFDRGYQTGRGERDDEVLRGLRLLCLTDDALGL